MFETNLPKLHLQMTSALESFSIQIPQLFKNVSLLLTSRIQLRSYIKAPGKTDKGK